MDIIWKQMQSNKQNSAKPSSHSTGENSGAPTSSSANKTGSVAKKTSPTGTKKPPGITSAHDAKVNKFFLFYLSITDIII